MLCHVFWSQVEYKIVCFILITKELIFGFEILDLKVHFAASLSNFMVFENDSDLKCKCIKIFDNFFIG